MKYTDEYRDPATAQRLISEILAQAAVPRRSNRVQGSASSIRIMEFCGGHTHAIMRYGLRQVLAPRVVMTSGPGCPVCVTADADIDYCIALAHLPGVMVATFGDMIRVPGTRSSLQEARAAGANVHIVYSALDALELARKEPQRAVVMLGIGFVPAKRRDLAFSARATGGRVRRLLAPIPGGAPGRGMGIAEGGILPRVAVRAAG